MTWANAASLPAHKFTKYSSEDGLEEYIIQNIMQDHRGLMWFATWDGLYNYDGYRFRRFKAGSNGVRPANWCRCRRRSAKREPYHRPPTPH